jgi:coenzyme Q-binding protein COQ10
MTVGITRCARASRAGVVLDASTPQVHAASVPEHPSGPFRQVENRWSFAPAEGGCDVQFHIAYEFKSPALQMLAGSLFDRVFRCYTQAFENRARAVYGPPDAGTAPGA